MAGIQEQYNQRAAESQTKIGDLYDKQLAAQKVGLESAYNQSLSDQEYAKSQIDPTYRRASNDLAAQYERNKRNLNMQAMVNGLNTGAGSQQQLALNNVWTKNYANLQGERANALAAADKGIADLKTNYQSQIAQAIAENDYKRAAALLDDYNNNQSWLETAAKNLAAMGDFSGYALLYGQPQADTMRQTWIASNPDLAWNLKLINAAEYKRMTGNDAPGTVTASKGGGGGYYGGNNKKKDDGSGSKEDPFATYKSITPDVATKVAGSAGYDSRGIPVVYSPDNKNTTTKQTTTTTSSGYDWRGIPIAYSPDKKK